MEQLAQIAAQLGIDNSFYYLFGMMYVLFLLLSTIYVKPFQKLIIYRREKTEGVKKEAQELTAQAEDKFSQYKTRLKAVNDKARQSFRDSEEAARKEESKIVAEASSKAKDSLQTTQRELDVQRKAALEALSGEISGIATDIATKVMGRQVSAR